MTLFDVAPLYGRGLAEHRFGTVLKRRPRDSFVLSTKVGRWLKPAPAGPSTSSRDRGGLWFDTVVDYSYDGTMRAFEQSLQRLALPRIDIALIHDPDDHWEQAIGQAYPALARMREEGTIRAVGAGMNQSAMLARFAREGDFDVFLVAGRYTLLDQSALADLLPLCSELGIGLFVGGVMNSGVLADPTAGSHFDYLPAPADIVARAVRIRQVCERHGVPVRDAAIQPPQMRSSVVGRRREIDDSMTVPRSRPG